MKKFLLVAGLALGFALASQQQAHAWINCRFSIGLNWHWQSGGNSFLWGLWTNGQPCCQIGGPPTGCFPGPGPGYFPYFGANQQGNPQTPNPAVNAPGVQTNPGQQSAYGFTGTNPYQAVSYPGSGGYFTPGTGAYYPGYSGYFQPPSYWYGR